VKYSILIPVYKPDNLLKKAVECLKVDNDTEVLISVNDSEKYPLEQCLENELIKKGVKIYKQKRNIGLWVNHAFLIDKSCGEWVKFIHADDYLASSYWATVNPYLNNQISIVVSLPTYYRVGETTKSPTTEFLVSSTRIYEIDEYIDRLKIVGNEFGHPSLWLLNGEKVRKLKEYWSNNYHSDYVVALKMSSLGKICLLPPGEVLCGEHPNRDTHKQGFTSALRRVRATFEKLATNELSQLRHVAYIYFTGSSILLWRSFASRLIRGPRSELIQSFVILLKMSIYSVMYLLMGRVCLSDLRKYMNWNSSHGLYGPRNGRCIDKFEFFK